MPPLWGRSGRVCYDDSHATTSLDHHTSSLAAPVAPSSDHANHKDRRVERSPPVQTRLQNNYTRYDCSRGSFEDNVPGTDPVFQDLPQLCVRSEEQEHGAIQILSFLLQLLRTILG